MNQEKYWLSNTMVAGLLTGALNKFITHPFDTIKANSQIDPQQIKNKKDMMMVGFRRKL